MGEMGVQYVCVCGCVPWTDAVERGDSKIRSAKGPTDATDRPRKAPKRGKRAHRRDRPRKTPKRGVNFAESDLL